MSLDFFRVNVWLVLPVFTVVVNVIAAIQGYRNSVQRCNPYGTTRWLYAWGIFVWGDALVIAPFFVLVGVVAMILNNFNLFMLAFCSFWLIRSMGESIYWFNQQFSTVIKEKPEHVPFFGKLVKGESAWFMMQVYMQCVAVFALIGVIYFAAAWLQ